jgi:hypothetical protein
MVKERSFQPLKSKSGEHIGERSPAGEQALKRQNVFSKKFKIPNHFSLLIFHSGLIMRFEGRLLGGTTCFFKDLAP